MPYNLEKYDELKKQVENVIEQSNTARKETADLLAGVIKALDNLLVGMRGTSMKDSKYPAYDKKFVKALQGAMYSCCDENNA